MILADWPVLYVRGGKEEGKEVRLGVIMTGQLCTGGMVFMHIRERGGK